MLEDNRLISVHNLSGYLNAIKLKATTRRYCSFLLARHFTSLDRAGPWVRTFGRRAMGGNWHDIATLQVSPVDVWTSHPSSSLFTTEAKKRITWRRHILVQADASVHSCKSATATRQYWFQRGRFVRNSPNRKTSTRSGYRFLDVPSHLYARLCLSVRPSGRQVMGP